jgi:hypothetical protein
MSYWFLFLELKTNPHELQLARLKHELSSRQELSTKCQQARAERSQIISEIKQLQKTLNGFLPATERILASCSDITAVFPSTRELLGRVRMERRVKLLPNALHALYTKLMSYQEVFGESGDT